MASNYYRKLGDDTYQCVICLRPYTGFSARHEAKTCCSKQKPLNETALRAAAEIVAMAIDYTDPDYGFADDADEVPLKPRRRHRETVADGSSKSKKADAILSKIYHESRAAERARFEALLGDVGLVEVRRQTPLQKLAYAFHLGSWAAVRAAARDMAAEAVAKALEPYQLKAAPAAVIDEIGAMLAELGFNPDKDYT